MSMKTSATNTKLVWLKIKGSPEINPDCIKNKNKMIIIFIKNFILMLLCQNCNYI